MHLWLTEAPLSADFSLQRPGFNAMYLHVKFVADEVP
jgi:hypothetical protein